MARHVARLNRFGFDGLGSCILNNFKLYRFTIRIKSESGQSYHMMSTKANKKDGRLKQYPVIFIGILHIPNISLDI